MTPRKPAKPRGKTAKKTANELQQATVGTETKLLVNAGNVAATTKGTADPENIVMTMAPPDRAPFVEEGTQRERLSFNRPAPKFAVRIQDGTADAAFTPDYLNSDVVEWCAGITAVAGTGLEVGIMVTNLIGKYATRAYGGVVRSQKQFNEMLAQAVALAPIR